MKYGNEKELRAMLDPGPMPAAAQRKWDDAFARLDSVAQARPARPAYWR